MTPKMRMDLDGRNREVMQRHRPASIVLPATASSNTHHNRELTHHIKGHIHHSKATVSNPRAMASNSNPAMAARHLSSLDIRPNKASIREGNRLAARHPRHHGTTDMASWNA
jgi:hypothetical protein